MNKYVLPDTKVVDCYERLRLVLDVSKIAVWDWDVASDTVFYSKEWKLMRGISEDEGWGSPSGLLDSVHPDERSERESQKARWLEGRNDHIESEYRVKHKSGSWVRISERVKVVRDSAGKVSRLVGGQTKVTPQYVSQPSSKLGVNSFAILSDDLPIATLRFEGNNCVYANETWSKLTGLPFESALGDGHLDPSHPEDRLRYIEGREKYLHGPPGETIVINGVEGRYLNSDGSVKWFLAQLRMQYSADGALASNTATMIDITDRKELEQQQERLIAILESTSDYICMATADCKILWCNAPFSKFRPDLDPSKDANCMDKYPPSSKKIIAEIAIPAAIENGSWSGEINLLDSNGDEVPVSQVLNVHKAADGSVEYFSAIMRDIRELKEADESLQSMKDRLQLVLGGASVGTFEYHPTDDVVTWDERMMKIYGVCPDDFRGVKDDFYQRIPPDERQQRRADFDALMESGQNTSEFEIVRPNGERRHVFTEQLVLRNDRDEIKKVIGLCIDVTAQRTTQLALQETQTHLRVMTDNVPSMLFRYVRHPDGTHEFPFVSPGCRELFEVEPQDLMDDAEVHFKQLHRDDVIRVNGLFEESHENLTPFKSEHRINLPEQGLRWVQVISGVTRREDGAVVWDGLAIDITQRKEAEIELQETQTHLGVMTDNVPSMLYRYVRYPDGTHEFPLVSPGCREVFEVEPQDVIDDAEVLFKQVHADDIIRVGELIEESHENLTPFKSEHRINLPERGLRWVGIISKPTLRDDGAVVWDGLAIDITQRKEAEIELHKAKMKDEFLANVSHELRTPLNAILGMTEGLQEGIFGSLTLKQSESLKVIEHSGGHLLGLINEMLNLAKIESGQLKLAFSAVEVRELCESSLHFVTHQADKKNIQLNVELPFNIPKIKIDEQRIRQVLINLLGNAVKFTPAGGCVTVKVERILPAGKDVGKTLRVAVTDTGIGIESSKLDSLFVPFVQVDSSLSRNYEGTGLGLALVKQYVELHGGKVAVASEPGIGSCFEFTLPYREPAVDDLPEKKLRLESPNEAPPLAPPASSASLPVVLLAEDNEDIALATSSFLKASGFRVLHALNGAIAVKMAVEHTPDVILMDIQMPGVDGLEAMKRLRKIPEHSETPIIAVTGLAQQFDAKRCIDAGANEYLCKPYRMGDLVTSIRKILSQRATA